MDLRRAWCLPYFLQRRPFCNGAAHLHFKLQLEAVENAQPLSDKLASFEKLIRETYEREGRERFHLEKEIEGLASETQALSGPARRHESAGRLGRSPT
jgi:hypothetical protein